MNRRPKLQLLTEAAPPAEAAAVIAAVERFMRDTAPPPAPSTKPNPWLRAALFEGIDREHVGLSSWGDGHPWGA